jgi:hypothetical protein
MFFSSVGTVFSSAITSLNRGQSGAQGSQALSLAQYLNRAINLFNRGRKAWDTIATLSEVISLGELSAAERAAFTVGLNALSALGVHVSLPTVKIPVPESMIRKLRKKAGPFFDIKQGQELIGAAVAALITTMLGFKAVDIHASYHGVDAIMKSKTVGFMVVEAKGGPGATLASTQSGMQMYDQWIKTRIEKALKGNRGPDADALQKVKNGPMLAAVVKTDLKVEKQIAVKIQTFPNIRSWGDPFE